jgi:hypothetical protein
MTKYLVRTALVACIATLISIPLAAQNPAEDSGAKGQANTQDTHIKNSNPTNSPDQKIAPPPSKGGPKAKGAWGTCDLHIDNRTGLIVQVFFQGNLVGVVGPWGDLYPNITPGVAELYARAVFDDGSVLTFGPREYRCNGRDFTWSLVP